MNESNFQSRKSSQNSQFFNLDTSNLPVMKNIEVKEFSFFQPHPNIEQRGDNSQITSKQGNMNKKPNLPTSQNHHYAGHHHKEDSFSLNQSFNNAMNQQQILQDDYSHENVFTRMPKRQQLGLFAPNEEYKYSSTGNKPLFDLDQNKLSTQQLSMNRRISEQKQQQNRGSLLTKTKSRPDSIEQSRHIDEQATDKQQKNLKKLIKLDRSIESRTLEGQIFLLLIGLQQNSKEKFLLEQILQVYISLENFSYALYAENLNFMIIIMNNNTKAVDQLKELTEQIVKQDYQESMIGVEQLYQDTIQRYLLDYQREFIVVDKDDAYHLIDSWNKKKQQMQDNQCGSIFKRRKMWFEEEPKQTWFGQILERLSFYI